jgi:hypothetical protein
MKLFSLATSASRAILLTPPCWMVCHGCARSLASARCQSVMCRSRHCCRLQQQLPSYRCQQSHVLHTVHVWLCAQLGLWFVLHNESCYGGIAEHTTPLLPAAAASFEPSKLGVSKAESDGACRTHWQQAAAYHMAVTVMPVAFLRSADAQHTDSRQQHIQTLAFLPCHVSMRLLQRLNRSGTRRRWQHSCMSALYICLKFQSLRLLQSSLLC